MSDTRLQILLRLSDAHIHSGSSLAADFSVSRAAVWKHIKHLRKQGVEIEAIPGKGYRLLRSVTLLNEQLILDQLSGRIRKQVELYIRQKTDSTNNWLRQKMSSLNAGAVCLAETQTAGRGTRGRSWLSPIGSNVYLSVYWQFRRAPAEMTGLGLALAVAAADALNQQGYEVAVKWPNDIVTSRGKLGGILVDLSGEMNGDSQAIIGLGLNCGMHRKHQKYVDQPIDDISWLTQDSDMDRNQLAALMIEKIIETCSHYNSHGFDGFRDGWKRFDSLYNQAVTLTTSQQQLDGVARGIDENGALLLETNGACHAYSSGDVSVRMTL